MEGDEAYILCTGYTDDAVAKAQLNPYEVEGSCTYEQLATKAQTAKKNDVWTLSAAHDPYPIGTAFAYGGGGASDWKVVQLGNRISNAAIKLTLGAYDPGNLDFSLNQDADKTLDIPAATTSAPGLMSKNDKVKLNGLNAVTGTNDGTNWTSIEIGNVTKNIPSGGGGASITIVTADPTSSTVGTVGAMQYNSANGVMWVCKAVAGSTYTWADTRPHIIERTITETS